MQGRRGGGSERRQGRVAARTGVADADWLAGCRSRPKIQVQGGRFSGTGLGPGRARNQAWVPPPSPRRGFSPVGSEPTACFGETFTASASGLPQSPYNPAPFLQIHAPCLEAATVSIAGQVPRRC